MRAGISSQAETENVRIGSLRYRGGRAADAAPPGRRGSQAPPAKMAVPGGVCVTLGCVAAEAFDYRPVLRNLELRHNLLHGGDHGRWTHYVVCPGAGISELGPNDVGGNEPGVALPGLRGVGDNVDHPQPGDRRLELVELALVYDPVLGNAAVEDDHLLPLQAPCPSRVGEVAKHASHRSDADAAGEEGELGKVISKEEATVRPLDVDGCTYRKGVERVL